MKKTYPPGDWRSLLAVDSFQLPLQVNLTALPAAKRLPVWHRIQQHSPATAELLRSTDFQQDKALLEEVFGPVSIAVDLAVIGEQNDGIS